MAYNRRNLLTRMIDVQMIVLEHTSRGVTQEWVYRNEVYPKLRISRRTFYEYLGTPAKMELKKIEALPKQMEIGL